MPATTIVQMFLDEFVIDGDLYVLAQRGDLPAGFEAVDGMEAQALLARSGSPVLGLRDARDGQWRVHGAYGDLVLGVRPRAAAATCLDPTEPPVPLADLVDEPPLDVDHWIEIRVVDDAHTPMAEERYELSLPDGRVVEGRTDERGAIYVDRIHKAGHCRIVLPDLALDLPAAA